MALRMQIDHGWARMGTDLNIREIRGQNSPSATSTRKTLGALCASVAKITTEILGEDKDKIVYFDPPPRRRARGAMGPSCRVRSRSQRRPQTQASIQHFEQRSPAFRS